MARRYVVTGASGFLGQHLVRSLRADGQDVLPVVRAPGPSDAFGARTLDDVWATPSLLDGADALVHAAAIRHRFGVSREAYAQSNVGTTARLLETARGRVQRFVYVSSVGVYGFPENLPITEGHPFTPRTLYSETKVEAERTVRAACERGLLATVIVRPTIVYGSGDRNGMMDKMARMIKSGTYAIVGDGENVLHHTHVDDIVMGTKLACDRPEASGEDFILCGPETITLRRLSELTARALGRRLLRVRIPLRLARAVATLIDRTGPIVPPSLRREPPINNEKLDVMTRAVSFNCDKARRLLGFSPVVGYEEGIRRTFATSLRRE
ncbi:MAG: NAD-dependent epimerase/dehydratase family protein [Polyangiaceae bacterium]|jgi:nucleoside-diphosphate-sugar epimerase